MSQRISPRGHLDVSRLACRLPPNAATPAASRTIGRMGVGVTPSEPPRTHSTRRGIGSSKAPARVGAGGTPMQSTTSRSTALLFWATPASCGARGTLGGRCPPSRGGHGAAGSRGRCRRGPVCVLVVFARRAPGCPRPVRRHAGAGASARRANVAGGPACAGRRRSTSVSGRNIGPGLLGVRRRALRR